MLLCIGLRVLFFIRFCLGLHYFAVCLEIAYLKFYVYELKLRSVSDF
jgi:hypothetical protein